MYYNYEDEKLSWLEYYVLNRYTVEGGVPRCYGNRIKQADPATFHPLNSTWAADAHRVYFTTTVVRGADPKTFRVLNEQFAWDRNIYYLGGILKGANAASFQVLDKGWYRSNHGPVFEGYARHKNGIWFYCSTIGKPRILKRAEPETFEVLGYAYARDAKSVFYSGTYINQANPEIFEPLSQTYSRDNHHVFYCNRMVEGADRDTFEVVDADLYRARDKNYLYDYDFRVEARAS